LVPKSNFHKNNSKKSDWQYFNCEIIVIFDASMRNWYSFPAPSLQQIRTALFKLAGREEQACVAGRLTEYGFTERCIAGLGVLNSFQAKEADQAFEALQKFTDNHQDWLFGHFSYDLKNQLEPQLSSLHTDKIGFSLLHFFQPRVVIRCDAQNNLLIGVKGNQQEAQRVYESILNCKIPEQILPSEIHIQAQTSKADYLKTVQALKNHIARGDIYEINYCIGFFAENIVIDPVVLQLQLNRIAAAPFSVFYKQGDLYLCCASPERFLSKESENLRSQPIKGTRPRGQTPEEDERLRQELANDHKERTENVMIVDLVRNDLSRSAQKGSVYVPELYGIHTFQTVHQMVSTVQAKLADDVHPVQAIAHAFPMGSMTGAPKVRMMELAERYEKMRRGLYAGAVGYFTPEKDFDFNVVIRSIQYNAAEQYLSFMVGSAITAASDAEKEYEECLVKAAGLFEALALRQAQS
jgi:para-aminobenzoate synthetase component 1